MAEKEANSNGNPEQTRRPLGVPHSLGDLPDYFREKSRVDRDFKDGIDCAEQVVEIIEYVSRMTAAGEHESVELPLLPSRKIFYVDELQSASLALKELTLEVIQAVPKADERGSSPSGRVWWQGHNGDHIVNLIETHGRDVIGEWMKITAVTDIPEELMYLPQREYTEKEQKAIRISEALQKVGLGQTDRALNAKLDYYELVHSWPVTTDHIPADEQTA